MLKFIGRNLLAGIVMVFVISTLTFFLLGSNGASIARTLLGENATPAQIEAKEHALGLDRGLFERYMDWITHALRGDLGDSWLTNQPVSSALMDRLPVTLSLAIVAVLVTGIVSVFIGVVAAYRGGWIDRVVQVLGIAGFAMPGVWLALILVLVFAITLAWLPATGYVPIGKSLSGWAAALALPVIAISVSSVAATAQQVRGAMIDTLNQDYVRTLRSRGLPERSVVLRHALRNAAPAGSHRALVGVHQSARQHSGHRAHLRASRDRIDGARRDRRRRQPAGTRSRRDDGARRRYRESRDRPAQRLAQPEGA